MFDFLKGIFGSKEKEPEIIAIKNIPSVLDRQDRALADTLHLETETPVRNIHNAVASLQLVVNNLNGAEQNPEIHPKIKTIAKNSLPLFLKAMNSSLSKELPDDTEEFYTAIVENLKGCINAMRGQGRYLQVVFPEEMKATKAGIDVIGREINVMTGALARFKQERAKIDAAKKSYADLAAVKEDVKKSYEREERFKNRIQESTVREAEITENLKKLSRDPVLLAADGQKAALADREKDREEQMKVYAALTMNASHVFRKAEKIASRKNLTSEVHTLKKTMEILSDHAVAQTDEIISSLEASCPITQKMIDAGEIALKNKEERAIFSDPAGFCSTLSSACSKYHTVSAECLELGRVLATNPVITKMQSLERERLQIVAMREREEQSLRELLLWREKTVQDKPRLFGELVKIMGEILGNTVQIQDDDPVPVGG